MALSKERHTPAWVNPAAVVAEYGVKAGSTIYAGALVQLDANGWLIPAAKAANQVTVGRAEETVVSPATDASGDKTARVRSGVFRWDNLGADAVARAEIGDSVYVEDDHTIRKTQNANGTKAGRLMQVDDQGAWVATGILYLA